MVSKLRFNKYMDEKLKSDSRLRLQAGLRLIWHCQCCLGELHAYSCINSCCWSSPKPQSIFCAPFVGDNKNPGTPSPPTEPSRGMTNPFRKSCVNPQSGELHRPGHKRDTRAKRSVGTVLIRSSLDDFEPGTVGESTGGKGKSVKGSMVYSDVRRIERASAPRYVSRL